MLTDRYSTMKNQGLSVCADASFQNIPAAAAEVLRKKLGRGTIQTVCGVIGAMPQDTIEKAFGISYAAHRDAYAVFEKNNTVTVYAETEQALFLGVCSLALRNGALGEGLIYTYPLVDFRMIKLYLPPQSELTYCKELIDLCVCYGFNAVMFEVGGAMEYKSHPEINEAWRRYSRETSDHINGRGKNPHFPFRDTATYFEKNSIHCENGGGDVLPQNVVADLVSYCRARCMEVIPEMPSLSHSDYLLAAHPELAERKEDIYPDAYCPSRPETYKLLFDLLEEVLRVFRPKRLNIGHDELYSIGLCEACREKDPAELYAADIITIHDFLHRHGVTTMMWADKLIDCIDKKGHAWGGARQTVRHPKTNEVMEIVPALYTAINKIPKDVQLLHWFWSMDAQTEKDFKRRGFFTAFGNFEPRRMHHIVPRIQNGMDGICISNWSRVDELHVQRNGVYFDLAYAAYLLWHENPQEDNMEACLQLVGDSLYRYRLSGAPYRAEIMHTADLDWPQKLYLDGYEVNREENRLGTYVITYQSGKTERLPMEYGRTIGDMHASCCRPESDWCDSYEIDRRLAEPAYSCTYEMRGDAVWYRFAVCANEPIQSLCAEILPQYKDKVKVEIG